MATQLTLNDGSLNSAGSLLLKTNGTTTAVTIDTSQNMGLGVTPSAWASAYKVLDVGNTSSFYFDSSGAVVSNNSFINSSFQYRYKTSNAATRYEQTSAGQHQWHTAASGTAGNAISFTQAMTLDASGNLGIGTTSPSTYGKFAVINTDYSFGTFGTTNGGAVTVNIGSNSVTAGGYVGTVTNHAFVFQTNSTERARIDSSGNFLVGLTSGSARLMSTGSTGNNAFTFIHTTAGDGVGVITNNNASFASGLVAFNSAAAAGSGWSFIQGWSSNFGSLRLNIRGDGNIYNVNGTYGAISDIKLKENISDATPKLNSLMQVRVVNYNFIGDDQKQLGVIAQELEQIFPGMVDETPDYERVVTTDEDGNEKTEQVSLGTTTKSVKYSVFVPMLIKAIQEQQAIITQLQADVAALKG